MPKLKDIIDLIKADTIYFQNVNEDYIADTSDKLCYLKFDCWNTEVVKIEPLHTHDIVITIQ